MRIDIDHLSYYYHAKKPILRDINLTLEGTKPIAIIGQNGAGKTTLVKHFNRILTPTDGEVRIDGKSTVTQSTAKWALQVGYVFQNPADQLFLESVRKEFEFGPKKIGMNSKLIKSRLKMVSKLVGLENSLDVHPFDLTDNQRKFCTIGAVIMMDPSVVIFDEPTCGQDIKGNLRLQQVIQNLSRQGKLCITISHDMRFVANNFKRIIVLLRGKVRLDGTPTEVFSQKEVLKSCFITPPPLTRVGQSVGLPQPVFTTDAFINALRNRNKA